MPRPALSQVPSAQARPVVGNTPGTLVTRAALPWRLHAARGAQTAAAAQPGHPVRVVIPDRRPGSAATGSRSQTLGRPAWHHGDLAHLGTELAVPSPPALRRHRRGIGS